MFIDEVTITVKSGKGGDGSAAFRREKFVPRGGPWGGNGGKGGDIYIETVEDLGILRRYRNQKLWKAQNGGDGQGAKKHGRDGDDLILLVPVGTVVTDTTRATSYDFSDVGKKICIVRGGKGGRGNVEFTTATNQAPRFFEKGWKGEEKNLHLELKLIADVGLIGLPNVGKSSLLNELTNASVKVAPYPFTTLEPNLGVVDRLILADIPGLIEGASKGRGLGSKFLRHIARTRVLAHCIASDSADPLKDYGTVRQEMEAFNPELMKKKEIILLTKTDLVDEATLKQKLKTLKKLKKEVYPVSIHDWDKIQVLRTRLLKEKLSSQSSPFPSSKGN